MELTYKPETDNVVGFERRCFTDSANSFTNMREPYTCWLKSTERRQYIGYEREVKPAKENPALFNTFTNKRPMHHMVFPLQQLTAAKEEVIKPVLDHVLTQFCCGIAALSDYFLDWLASPLQDLGMKTGAPLVSAGCETSHGDAFARPRR